MSTVAFQITSLTIVYSTVYSGADQRKHQSSASPDFWGEFIGDRWIPRTEGHDVIMPLGQSSADEAAPNWTDNCAVPGAFNSLRPKQNGRHFADDIFKCIFLNDNIWISINISLKFVSKGPINNIPALVQIMAWRRPGDKPLFEPMMVSLTTHICVTRPQWKEITSKSTKLHNTALK